MTVTITTTMIGATTTRNYEGIGGVGDWPFVVEAVTSQSLLTSMRPL